MATNEGTEAPEQTRGEVIAQFVRRTEAAVAPAGGLSLRLTILLTFAGGCMTLASAPVDMLGVMVIVALAASLTRK